MADGDNEFAGFSEEGLQLLRKLPERDKTWFEANRATYVREVLEPVKAFAAALGARCREEISEALEVVPKTNGSISPINNDLRFTPGAAPYRDHLMVNFWEGAPKKTAPTLRVRFSATDCGYAAGAAFDPKSLERWRTLVDAQDTGEALAAALDDLAVAHPQLDVAGAGLKRVPKEFDPDHPRAELLKHKALQVRWSEPTPGAITEPAFVDHCVDQLVELAPIHRWLVQNLGAS